jgi:hypothetical protein
MSSGIRWAAAAALALTLRPAIALALDLTAGSGADQSCPPSARSLALSAAAIAYTQPLPVLAITDYGNGRYRPGAGDNLGVGIAFGELSGDVNGWCAGILYRVEYHAQASKDLLDVLVANHFGNTFDAGRIYSLYLSEKSFKADGLRLRKTLDFAFADRWSVTLGFGASLLHASEGEEQSLTGQVTATSPNFAVGTGSWLQTVTDINYADFNPFVAPGNPRGIGFSSDLELQLRAPGGVQLDFTAMDPLGRIYWSEVPREFQTLNTASVAYNANLDREAFVNGVESRVAFVETIPAKIELVAEFPVTARWTLQMQDDWVDAAQFPAVGTAYLGGFGTARLQYDLRTQAVSVGGVWRLFSASITSNNFHLQRASALGVALHAAHSW